jgi:hypothetical protein
MASFDTNELNRTERAERSYPMSARNNAPAWIAGIVVVAAIVIGAFVYETRGTHESVAPTATHEMTQTPLPPPVNPAPPPEPAKPQ